MGRRYPDTGEQETRIFANQQPNLGCGVALRNGYQYHWRRWATADLLEMRDQ
jgi:hypothetical protein